ncbi:MAG: Gfo/Idh/MocA family oxidoreductase, partial [Candidatus Latescibacterota bacterium]
MAKKRCLMVGGSGMAGRWIEIWSGLLGERVEIVGLVDVSREVLKERGDALDLTEGQRFVDFATALAGVEADFCAIATPPQFHSEQA